MRVLLMLVTLGLTLPAWMSEARAEERYERKGRGDWRYEYKDGHREVKRERKPNGEWKEEIKDANCEIKRERTSSGEYKEEIKCK